MAKMNAIDWTAFILLIVGGINWGLVGVFDFNLVSAIFGTGFLADLIYGLVGASALYTIFSLSKIAK